MAGEEDLEARITRLERDVARLRDRVAQTSTDAAAARILAGGADHDVSEVRAELRAHTQALTALRDTQREMQESQREMQESQREMQQSLHELQQSQREMRATLLDHGLRLDALEAHLTAVEARLDSLETEMRAGFTEMRAGMAQIVTLLGGTPPAA